MQPSKTMKLPPMVWLLKNGWKLNGTRKPKDLLWAMQIWSWVLQCHPSDKYEAK